MALCGDNSGIVDKSLNCDNIIESSKLWSFCKIGRIETLACGRKQQTAEDQTGGATGGESPTPAKGVLEYDPRKI